MITVNNQFRSKTQDEIRRKVNEAFLQIILLKSRQ